MTVANVHVHTEQAAVHITISGEIDLDNAATVEDQLFAAIDNHTTAAVLDLSNLLYMDSSGLRMLFVLATRLDTLQIRLELVARRGSPARRVLELTGFDAFASLRH
jgi:anti-anti-sigma factor